MDRPCPISMDLSRLTTKLSGLQKQMTNKKKIKKGTEQDINFYIFQTEDKSVFESSIE